jgi:putative SOS response-associated peptidase YedK
LIPYWAEDPEKVEHLICAQAEGLASKDSFRMPLRQKRAIVFADSYYNSLRQNKKDQFYRILYKNHPVLAFAAIWDVWISPSGKEYYSFSIITTEADKELSEKGWSRMPLIFTEEEQISQWLDKEMPLNDITKMLKTSEIDSLYCYPVSDELMKVTNDYPELHNEI